MKHLVLIGLMGVGKTTVGRKCAERLGRAFVDTDDVVEALAQMTVADIFTHFGEARFRELERQAVDDVSASPTPLVIACGGGTVVDADNRRRLRDSSVVVWLRAPVAVLTTRVGDATSRPLLAGDPTQALTRLEASREAAYDAAADGVVDTAELDVAAVVDAVIEVYAS